MVSPRRPSVFSSANSDTKLLGKWPRLSLDEPSTPSMIYGA
jgi:hypothetical protein